MKKTIKELLEIDNIIGNIYKRLPEVKETKFKYVYDKFYNLNLKEPLKQLKEDIEELEILHALEDEKTKAILRDTNGHYQYSKDEEIKLLKAKREAYNDLMKKEIEVKPYISTYKPSLTDEESEELSGLII